MKTPGPPVSTRNRERTQMGETRLVLARRTALLLLLAVSVIVLVRLAVSS